MKRSRLLPALIGIAAAALPAAWGFMRPVGGFDLTWSSIDGGGRGRNSPSAGNNFALSGAIGQHDAGTLAGSGFQLRGGFWSAPRVCYPDCNFTGTLTIADFGCFQTRFVAGDPYADCNGVGGLTIADFGCFQTRFVAGCP